MANESGWGIIIRGDKKLAEKILRDALTRDQTNAQLYLQMIDLAFSGDAYNEADVLEAFDLALHSELPDFEKVRFSQRKLEFLEDFGSNIGLLQDHFEYHMKLYKTVGIPSAKRKIKAEPGTVPVVQPPVEDKRFRADGQIATPSAAQVSQAGPVQDFGAAYYQQGNYYYPNQQAADAANQSYAYNQYGSYYYPPPQQY